MNTESLHKEIENFENDAKNATNFNDWIESNKEIFIRQLLLTKVQKNKKIPPINLNNNNFNTPIGTLIIREILVPLLWNDNIKSKKSNEIYYFFGVIENNMHIDYSKSIIKTHYDTFFEIPKMAIKCDTTSLEFNLSIYCTVIKNSTVSEFSSKKKAGKINDLIFKFNLFAKSVFKLSDIKNKNEMKFLITFNNSNNDNNIDLNSSSKLNSFTRTANCLTQNLNDWKTAHSIINFKPYLNYDIEYFRGNFIINFTNQYKSATFSKDKLNFSDDDNIFLSDTSISFDVNKIIIENKESDKKVILKYTDNCSIIECNFNTSDKLNQFLLYLDKVNKYSKEWNNLMVMPYDTKPYQQIMRNCVRDQKNAFQLLSESINYNI